jgi:predicted O-methyltransferase YrrM
MPFIFAQDIYGWYDEREALLLHKYASIAPDGIFVELGSYRGRSLVTLSCSYAYRKVIAIDAFKLDSKESDLRDTIRKYALANVEVMIGEFSKFVSKISEPISFLHIDGGHNLSEVRTDFETYFPLVTKGGYIAFHDSNCDAFEVKKYIQEELSKRHDVEFVERVEGVLGLDVWRKL